LVLEKKREHHRAFHNHPTPFPASIDALKSPAKYIISAFLYEMLDGLCSIGLYLPGGGLGDIRSTLEIVLQSEIMEGLAGFHECTGFLPQQEQGAMTGRLLDGERDNSRRIRIMAQGVT
jgi:hypothetical protein